MTEMAETKEQTVTFTNPQSKVLEEVLNKVMSDKTSVAKIMTSYDIAMIVCDIIEKVSNKIKSKKSVPNLTPTEKLELACAIMGNVAGRLRHVRIPSMDRNIITEEEYNFIVTMTGDDTRSLISGVITIVNGSKQFGSIAELADEAMATGFSCFKFFKSRKKSVVKKVKI
jgi:hypothetical protein